MAEQKSALFINPKVLLAIYCVMPLALVFICFDTLLLNNQLQNTLPRDPRAFAWFVLLFMIPHIIASFFSFVDREYFEHYKPQLLRGAQIAVILGIFLPALAGATILPLLAFATYTMVHVFMQQSGVSKSLMKNSAPAHVYWQWLGIAIAIVIYAYLLIPIPWLQNITIEPSILISAGLIVFSIYSLLALNIVKQSRTRLGKIYFLGSHCIPIMGALFIFTDYPILAFLIPRIIHDLTAYTFYITHDNNRFSETRSNLIYRVTSKLKIPVYIASPALSVLLTFTIVEFNTTVLTVILTCIIFLHYYTESIMWKRDALHRMQIKFSPYT
jgi:hypothetical protein